MKENFEYSKQQYQEKHVNPRKRKERLELAVALLFVAILATGYLTQHVLHWW